ncbi:energy-coupling factor transporter transmembrane protein EcfT [Siphonobacter sp. SORGH_AS 1065]|nr:energy-coupling factor transporter transmembrane protein EcfT [Siphonobacter sp. SORGH_AS_1065]
MNWPEINFDKQTQSIIRTHSPYLFALIIGMIVSSFFVKNAYLPIVSLTFLSVIILIFIKILVSVQSNSFRMFAIGFISFILLLSYFLSPIKEKYEKEYMATKVENYIRSHFSRK